MFAMTPNPTRDDRGRRAILAVGALAVSLGVLHHLEHLIRGHVGWPVTGEINGFTFSLLLYPVALVGLALTASGRNVGWYHAVTAATGFLLVAATHFGPVAPDPVGETHRHYEATAPLFGWVAVGIVVALLASLVALFALGIRAHARRQPTPAAA